MREARAHARANSWNVTCLCGRYELLSRDAESDSILESVTVATKVVDKTARLVVESKATTIIRFIGNSDSSTNVDAFDPVVLIAGICEQILMTRCAVDDVSSCNAACLCKLNNTRVCALLRSSLACSLRRLHPSHSPPQFHSLDFRKRLDNTDSYSGLCQLLCGMVERYNVRVILDGLDELEDRWVMRACVLQLA